MATAELAMALPVLILCAGAASAFVSITGTQMRAQDVAREVARLLARGDQAAAHRIAAQNFPGARVQVVEHGDTTQVVVSTVARPIGSLVPGITVSAQAFAANEHPTTEMITAWNVAANRRGDRGSASVWVLAFAGLVLFLGCASALRTVAATTRHRAEAAADLAALAAAGRIGVQDDICVAAARIAAMNGATFVACRPELATDGRGGKVRVTVAVQVNLLVVGRQTLTVTAQAARVPTVVTPPARAPTAVAQSSSVVPRP